ncbi:MAG: FAD-binding protein [Parasporobacterium sp.]|nr:FAD-binding protein [Parasporobacterium sp.]
MQTEHTMNSDILIIGGGIAGLFSAIKAREAGADVILTDKNYVSRSGATMWVDTFTVFNPEWGHNKEEWVDFLNHTFEGMNNPEWIDIYLKESYERYQDLRSWGIEFPKMPNGEDSVIAFRGMPIETRTTYRGWMFLPKLRAYALKIGVRIVDHVMITDLICQKEQVSGAVGFHSQNGELYCFHASAVIMCAGPSGFKSLKYLGVANLTGDGDAMAYRAGAEISGKDFAFGGIPAFQAEHNEETRVTDLDSREIDDICGKYRVWSAYLPQVSSFDLFVDAEGYRQTRFTTMDAVHQGRGPIYLDYDMVPPPMQEWAKQNLADWNEEFRLERLGIKDMKGKMWTDTFRSETSTGFANLGGGTGIAPKSLNCETSLKGLFAAGESFNSRMFGANYPYIGFAQANAMITAARAAAAAVEYAGREEKIQADEQIIAGLKERAFAPINRKGGFHPRWAIEQLHSLIFSYYVSIIKDGDRMDGALKLISFLENHVGPRLYAKDWHDLRLAHEAQNMLLNAEMMLKASLMREESRGAHYREDFPRRNDEEWLAWIRIRKEGEQMHLFKEPIPEKYIEQMPKTYEERYVSRFAGEMDT